jgi:hypothetical protein
MIEIALHRGVSRDIARSDARQWEQADISRGLRDKSTDCRRADMAGREGEVGPLTKPRAGIFAEMRTPSICREPSRVSEVRIFR